MDYCNTFDTFVPPSIAPLSPISTASSWGRSSSTTSDLYTPSLYQSADPLSLSLLDTESSSVRFFRDEEALVHEVLELLPSLRHLMVAIHAKDISSPPTMNFLTSRLPSALQSLFVLAPAASSDAPKVDALRIAVAVLVLPDVEDVAKVCVSGALGPLVTVTSFDSPVLPQVEVDTELLKNVPVGATRKSSPQRYYKPVEQQHHHVEEGAPINDLLSIDDIYTTNTGSTGVCAVLTLTDVKNLLPPTEEECCSRVLLVKRCHRLGSRCSTKIKSYFDNLLGKKDAVEHVLMLPLKSRCPSKCGRPVPPKTGFVVFREPCDAMVARSVGSDQVVNGNAIIKVETYDGF
ncbi:hypothetical protein FOL47_001088 [Perkinsus chesapeaki]|uniref:Uncharacterized protein n=1 Tax=Perkinsus chesapeaki TaxID=330153 RepID=A0A7J6MKC3_PERCH|nr:hypothetical protein FOL47_001088 [Perkinsus chesapeaki]